eukprot:GHVU01068509.1.p1 GENE.GHVU01068509.1~~GHVU01068509.1.p1  ORF type:complete len:311 (-),score=56.35 GHVU01068509.1:194-1126(-)
MMQLTVAKRNSEKSWTVDVPGEDPTVDDLQKAFCELTHFYPERQRFTIESATKGTPPKVLREGKLKGDYGLQDRGDVVHFKDLGVQISYRLVFVLEYLGPLIIFPAYFFLGHFLYDIVYGKDRFSHSDKSLTQQVGFLLVMFHYLKREVESLFVHRFSAGTMPITRLPINCGHYWVLFAAMVGFFLFHPNYEAPFESPAVVYALAALMILFEILNFQTHLVLRGLRDRGTKNRGVPQGWGFQLASCANYFWESLAWVTFSVLVNCATAWFFTIVAFGQMAIWARKKHSNYRKEFGDKYPRIRTAIVPFLL